MEKEMTLNEYQQKAMDTCLPSCDNFSYMMLNLVGEVGEFASKVAKAIRKGELSVGGNYPLSKNDLCVDNGGLFLSADEMTENDKELQKEAGDILWQLAGLCKVMGWSLEDVARQNLEKLASRKDRGVIDGNGDNR